MKILIYAHDFAPSVGGVESYVMALAQGLAARPTDACAASYEISVATQTPAAGFDDASLPFRVVRLPDAWTLWREMGGAEIVHLAGPVFLPMLFAWLRGKPFVIEQHGYTAVCPNGLLLYHPTCSACPGHFMARHYGECVRCNARVAGRWKSVRDLLLTFPRRWLAKHATRNLPISNHVRERLQLPRSQVIYYGVGDPLASMAGAHPPAAAFTLSQPMVFAYVGRLVAEKGLTVLLQAAALACASGHRFSVKLIGDGPERAVLQKLAGELGLAEIVEFTGFLQGPAMDAAVKDVSVVVMPSIWEETAGLAAMEQMMRGRLVIASDIGGLGEVVADAGLKFPPADVGVLAASMRKVLERPEIVAELGATARARALQFFLVQRMIEDHRRLYVELRV
jgi:glycosyltransferase involved in cell wall biosynthesis